MGTLCGTELEQVQIPKNDFIQLEVKPENLLIYINQRVPFFFLNQFLYFLPSNLVLVCLKLVCVCFVLQSILAR